MQLKLAKKNSNLAQIRGLVCILHLMLMDTLGSFPYCFGSTNLKSGIDFSLLSFCTVL